MTSPTNSKKVADMNVGEVFRLQGRLCVLVLHPAPEPIPLIKSLVDGWAGRQDVFKDQDCEPVDMPKTPAELVTFIREVQIREDLEEE